ncbi:MAG: hypothetical protein R3B13_13180 [Polyangiaceae bacterium]
MSSLILALEPSGSAALETLDGERITLNASRAFPPGSTLRGVAEDEARPFEVKVRGCKRTDADAERPFRVEGRLINLSRQQRERLKALD